MPCTITREEELWYEENANKRDCGVEWSNERLITAVACWLLEAVKNNRDLSYAPGYVKGWVKRHEKEDRERALREKQGAKLKKDRKEALAKLTPSQKKALGV